MIARRLFVIASALGLAAWGCDSQPSSAGPATPPLHPAMQDTASRGGPAPSMSPGRPALPADHPPIDHPLGDHPPVDHPPIDPPAGSTQPAKAAGAAAAGTPQPAAGGGIVAKLAQSGITLALPAGWVEEASTSAMRLATIRLPRADGDSEDGEISVSFAGGGLGPNVDRWAGQFAEKPKPVQTQKAVGDVQATFVELEGTFTGGGGPMMKAGAPKPGTKLVGVILQPPGSQQLLFFKGWGPKATMEKWRPSFDELAASVRLGK